MNKLTPHVDSLFDSVSFDENADDWLLIFTNNITVQVSGFWRALENDKIVLTTMLKGNKLLELSIDGQTADLTLVLTNMRSSLI